MSRFAVLSLLLACATFLAGQEPDKSGMKPVAPFLDEQTVAVIRVDLQRLPADALIRKLGPLGKMTEAELRQGVAPMLEKIKEAGVREVFLVISLADVPFEPPFAVVPTGDKTDSEALKALKLSDVQRMGAAYVMGSKRTIARLLDLKPVELPELARAFEAEQDSAVRAAVIVPESLRRALAETAPRLPAELGSVQVTSLLRTFRSATVLADVQPSLSLRLTLRSGSEDDAKELERLTDKMLAALAAETKAKRIPSFVQPLVELIKPKLDGNRLVLTLNERDLTTGLAPLLKKVEEAKLRTHSTNNLKHLALALHAYHDVHKRFPPHASYDKQGKPLLSWRVLILPYVDQNELYKQFRLDEPWDSEHNKKLIARMPSVFRDPMSNAGMHKTVYVVPVGKETVFPPGPEGSRIADIVDGTSNTIVIVQADDERAVVWTQPEDLKVDLKEPARGLAGKTRGIFFAAFADGSVRMISHSVTPETLRAVFTRGGGEAIQLDF